MSIVFISLAIIYLVVVLVTIFGIYWIRYSFSNPEASSKSDIVGYTVLGAIELFGLANIAIVLIKSLNGSLNPTQLSKVALMSFILMGLVASMIAIIGTTWVVAILRTSGEGNGNISTKGYTLLGSIEMFGLVAFGVIALIMNKIS